MLIHVTGLQKAIDKRDKGATTSLFDDDAGVKPKPTPLPSKIRVNLSPANRANPNSSTSSNSSHPHVGAGQTVLNPETGKQIKGGQFAPKQGIDQPGKNDESFTGPVTLDSHDGFLKRLFSGDVTADELHRHADTYLKAADTVKAELAKHTIPELLKMVGGYVHDKKKDHLVNQVYREGLQRLALGKTISYQPFSGETFEGATRKAIAGITDADIKQFAEERAERIAARKRALTDPQTYDEFRTFVHYRGEDKLTPEQRAKWDDLQAQHSRGLGILPPKPKPDEKVDVGTGGISVKESVHTKHGHAIWIAQLPARVDRDKYNELNAKAKALGGYYSSFGPKENHGFIFKSKEAADKFAGEGADTASKPAAEASVETVPEEPKRNPTAERLRAVADRMRERAEESLGRERKTNTAKRAREAGYADEEARKSIAMANTLQNIADSIETGEVKHLSGLTSRSQVETLNSVLSRAHWANVRAKRDAGQIGHMTDAEEVPVDASDVDMTEFPYPYIHRSFLQDAVRELQSKTGKKRLAGRLEMMYTSDDGYTVTSAERLGWLHEAADALKGSRAGDYLKERLEPIDRLHRMGIKDLPSLRAALREYLPLRSDRAKPDPIKEKERALIGRRIPGYFPTPRELAREVVHDADIKPGMKVLEPNGGKGNIADIVRDEHPGADLSTIEPVEDLRDILAAKGHKLVGRDFLDHGEQYDRIVMNPPFENRQDVEHVRNAYKLLKPGGRLVAIMSEGPFSGSSAKDQQFRDWLMSHGGRSEKLPDGSFTGAQAERQTGVSTRKIIIDKPMEAVQPMSKAIVVVGLSKSSDEDLCHKCGKPAGKWQYFCRPCLADTEGQQLDELGVCPRCGIKYSDDCSHCERCGYKPGDKRPKYHGISKAIVILGVRKAVDARDASTGDLFGGGDGPAMHTRCRICGRKLRDDVSRRRGIGPECWEKIGHHAAAIKKMPHPSKVAAEGNLAIDFDKEPETAPKSSAPVMSDDAYLRENYGTRPTASTGRYLDRKHLQDLRDQIERKQAQLDRLNGQQQRNGDLPGTFVTGRSGVSPAYSKKLNRQLDRTIDTAVDIVALTKEVPELRRRLELYEAGRINEQGRSIDSPAKLKKQITQAEAILASGLLKGNPLTAEERSIARDILKSAKEKLKRIKPEDYAPEAYQVEKSLASILVRGLRAAGKKMAKLGAPSTAPGVTAGKTSAQAPVHEIHALITSAMQSHKFTWHQVAHRTEKGPGGEYGHFSHLLSHSNPQAAMEKMRTHLQGLGHTVSEVKRNRITQGDKTKHVYQFQAHKDGQMHTFTAAKMDGPVSKSVDDPFGAHLGNLGFKNHSFARSGDTFTHTMDHHSPGSAAADLGNLLKSRGHSLGDSPEEVMSRQKASAGHIGPNRPTQAPSSSVRLTSQYKGITHHWNINKVAGNRPGGALRERPELPIGKEPKMMAKAVVVVMNRRLCRSCGRPADGAECYECLGRALVGG